MNNEVSKSHINIHSKRGYLNPPMVHIYAKDENVEFIKKAIATVKDRTLLMCHDITHKKYTRLMKKSIVEGLVELLNYFPSNIRIYETMIPSMILKDKGRIYMGLKRIEFGMYEMVYVRAINTMKRNSVSAIA